MASVDVTSEVDPVEAASSAAAPSGPAPGGSPWIYRPWVDLLVGCGGWSAPLLLTAWIAASRAREWAFAFYFLALIFNGGV